MQRTYSLPGLRAGLGALVALVVLLVGMGSCVASGASGPLTRLAAAVPLERGAGFGSPSGAEAQRVRVVQRVLARHGWAPGGVDGLFGPRTEAAVVRFQAAAGLAADGVVGPQTARALAQARSWLRRGAGYQVADGSRRVRALQRRLARAGLNPGPVDGRFGPRTEAAVARLQRTAKLNASGVVDGPTQRVLARGFERGPRAERDRQPVAAHLKDIGPRVLGSLAIRPFAQPTTQTSEGVGLWLALAIAAAGLLAGLLSGGLWTRGRTRPAAGVAGVSVPEPRDDQPQPQPQHWEAPRVYPVERPRFLAPAPAPTATPAPRPGPSSRPRVGELLAASGAATQATVRAALDNQRRTGGRLGEILVAHGAVKGSEVRDAVATQLGVGVAEPDDAPVPLLPSSTAHRLRAVALANGDDANVPVAVEDANDGVLQALAAELGVPFEPKLADPLALDELTRRAYGAIDVAELASALRRQQPVLSASTRGSRLHKVLAVALVVAVALAVLLDTTMTLAVLGTAAILLYTLTTGLRLLVAWKGSQEAATIDPSPADIAALDERELPVYTVLLPLYREKPATLRVLFDAIERLDYPKHKLDCMLLLEEHDRATQEAVERVDCPGVFRRIVVPPGGPQTKPMALLYGLRSARGALVTVYDAEDEPDPLQLKRAICAFRADGPQLGCLQAKLGYYNPRQNLLTRLFTLEYDAWFNLYLPGLARLGAPLPLGGTSNHFRRDALEECLAWDPYNVTEDADIGIRLTRLGWRVGLLESTTYEEANSRLPSWIRQRSRWVKGYLQTVLVHFRQPHRLVREIGWSRAAMLALGMGGLAITQLVMPISWALLVLWFVAEPAWLHAMFPGPVFYFALANLVVGNFALVYLGLQVAVERRHDDLAPAALLMPVYWLLMSAATALAFIELVIRPHHWHKTEHGLHFAADEVGPR